MDILRFFSTLELTDAMYSSERLFHAYTLRFWPFTDPVFSNLSINYNEIRELVLVNGIINSYIDILSRELVPLMETQYKK